MEPSNVTDFTEYDQAVHQYIVGVQSHDLATQMEAVKNFISDYLHRYFSKRYSVFIENFPDELFADFKRVCEVGINVGAYQDNKKLFFEVFIFISRSASFIGHFKEKLFLELFLKVIKNSDSAPCLDLIPLISSIEVLVSCDTNKSIFINENAIFNFYCYFPIKANNLSQRFKDICQRLYNDCGLPESEKSNLCPVQLKENLNQIINRYSSCQEEDIQYMLFTILKMLNRLRMLDKVKFNINQFFNCMNSTLMHVINTNDGLRFLRRMPNICHFLLTGFRNVFHIDSIDTLMSIAAMCAINISIKMEKFIRYRIYWTSNYEMNFYIIYLALVSFPIIDHNSNPWLRRMFVELHHWVRISIQNNLIEEFRFDWKFLIMQYYIKSIYTLNIPVTDQDIQSINLFMNTLVGNKDLNLHFSYLNSQWFIHLYQSLKDYQSLRSTGSAQIQIILQDLIVALSDKRYINKLKSDQKLFKYENLRSHYLPMITEDFIKSVFSQCQSQMCHAYNNQSLDHIDNEEIKLYNQIMRKVVIFLNESNYLDQKTAKDFMQLLNPNIIFSSNVEGDPNDIRSNSDDVVLYNASTETNALSKLPLHALFNWFYLIYEMKFMFGDINSKFADLN
ncbi:hypothetical protein RF11_11753 [Thelohanellus kitauei]|uniref:Uncharacterized protein n=1 Tax=Thelohanellus kitauei TaxID=669202 RepID=A0A0C2N4G7_THEKT|nr:hypothetical protein RF11_03848 [Thelohanellus kitauei]KII71235.1 hypothetical protein RF11_11753 [Thelohanellus kitauei]